MKLNKFALTLTVATLLPTFAYANTDPVAASFERDLHRESVSSSIAITGEVEPLTGLFNAALYGTTDPVLASFERDMYHEPFNPVAVIAGEPDSTNGTGDPVLASFERDLQHEPIAPAAVSGETDSLIVAFNAALYGTTDPVLASFERDMYHEPFNPAAALAGASDSTNGAGDPVLASFERDLHHEPIASAAVSGETDSLVDIFNIALRAETAESIKQVSIKGNHHGS